MAINFVSFIHPVGVGGDWSAIDHWQREKHGKQLPIEDKGNWLVITTPNGQRRRVPITNVAYIGEDGETSKVGK